MTAPRAIAADGGAGAGRATRRRVFIIDEHPVCRYGMAQLINSEPGLLVRGKAETSDRTLPALLATRAEVILIDVAPRHPDGTDLIRQIREAHPDAAVYSAFVER